VYRMDYEVSWASCIVAQDPFADESRCNAVLNGLRSSMVASAYKEDLIDSKHRSSGYSHTCTTKAIPVDLQSTILVCIAVMCKWTACAYTCGHEGPDTVRSGNECDDFIMRMEAHKASPYVHAIPLRCTLIQGGVWRNHELIPLKMPCPSCWSSSFWIDKSKDAKSLNRGN